MCGTSSIQKTFPKSLGFNSFWAVSVEEAATAAAGREEEKEASPAGASAAPGLTGRSAPAPMSPRRASPTVPRLEWGTQSSADDRRCFARGGRMW
ncbi:Fermitin Family-like 1 [Manis pentadactyla]|nr:Fermitin Family-like 1 [Manis pentadactyla]